MEYIFAIDQPIPLKNAKNADPNVVGAEFEKILITNGRQMKPRDVVDAARDKRSPLHKYFEWDDSIAAELYRLRQARTLIRIIRTPDENTADGSTRAFQSINVGAGVSYRAIDEIRQSAEFQMSLLKRADSELAAIQRRYRNLTDVCRIIEEARKRISEEMGADA